MNPDSLAGLLNGLPVDDRVKLLTAFMYSGDDSVVATIISRGSDVQKHELCLRALRLLTDSRIELKSASLS